MYRVSFIVRACLTLLIAVACLTVMPGCGSKVTADNYAKINPGQSEAEVVAILGKPTSTESETSAFGNGAKETWKDGDKTIMVGFLNGKVVATTKSGF